MKIHYKSDFDIFLTVKSAQHALPDSFLANNFSGFIGSGNDNIRKALFSRSEEEFKNCEIVNGQIHIICNNHGLKPGKLHVEIAMDIPDQTYPDGIRRVVTREDIGIELVKDHVESPIIASEVNMAMPVVIVDPIETSNIADGAVTNAKLSDDLQDKINSAVTSAQLDEALYGAGGSIEEPTGGVYDVISGVMQGVDVVGHGIGNLENRLNDLEADSVSQEQLNEVLYGEGGTMDNPTDGVYSVLDYLYNERIEEETREFQRISNRIDMELYGEDGNEENPTGGVYGALKNVSNQPVTKEMPIVVCKSLPANHPIEGARYFFAGGIPFLRPPKRDGVHDFYIRVNKGTVVSFEFERNDFCEHVTESAHKYDSTGRFVLEYKPFSHNADGTPSAIIIFKIDDSLHGSNGIDFKGTGATLWTRKNGVWNVHYLNQGYVDAAVTSKSNFEIRRSKLLYTEMPDLPRNTNNKVLIRELRIDTDNRAKSYTKRNRRIRIYVIRKRQSLNKTKDYYHFRKYRRVKSEHYKRSRAYSILLQMTNRGRKSIFKVPYIARYTNWHEGKKSKELFAMTIL